MASKSALNYLCAQRIISSRGTPTSSHLFIRRPQILLPCLPTRRFASQISAVPTAGRATISAPEEGSGPLLERRADRELPSIEKSRTWLKTLPIFIFLITISALGIFNYQKSSSSTVNSILYALRTNEHARKLLGDEIYFASKVPWIRGEMNLMHGSIDISFWVKGTKAQALTKFVSIRKRRDGFFQTLEWSLKTEDGQEIQLLDFENTADPMQQGPR